MNVKEKIKNKIWHLLQKTEANGATKEEALTALNKARELSEIYSVSISDVEKPMQGEKLNVREIPVFNSGYDFTGILFWLAKYFDCKITITNNIILNLYGYDTDIDLFEYFYSFVCNSCLNDLKEFKKTDDYEILTKYKGVHGRTIAANYIKGYAAEVSLKLKSEYNGRKEERAQSTALVLVEKEKKVDKFFNQSTKGKKFGTHKAGNANRKGGYFAGRSDGRNLNLRQGVNA